MSEVILHTDGKRGLWSNVAKAIRITDIKIGYIDDEFEPGKHPTFGELRVCFDPDTWDTDEDGWGSDADPDDAWEEEGVEEIVEEEEGGGGG